ncbi:RNA-directed DNA polymerase [Chryseobacterium sp. Leaf201]|uniref:RNA-directed DNA polymerase n=1 Tax=Chryseobacterium sp. Leaf201 TaxID=1735672 RepID=UPI0006F69410|nr:RNA-directed DNA polymerase [Chryseobacterium sp. Leaf201]KQM45883.1 hypothetical protein ASE55_11640 [Chryseobacterium sp. Leaf201]
MNNLNEFSRKELYYVYRKVKRDLYFEKDSILLKKIIEFEDHLEENIEILYDILSSKNLKRVISNLSVGSMTFFFKKIDFTDGNRSKIIAPKTIENARKSLFNIRSVECRFIGNIDIFFQMVGGLWINRIGYQIDELLSSNVYGCRLEKNNKKINQPYYRQNSNLYKPYFTDYKNWQNNLFKKVEQSEKDIVVITSDLRKYYHTIDIDYLKLKIDKLLSSSEVMTDGFDIFINEVLFNLIKKFNSKNNKFYSHFDQNEEKSQNGLPLTLNVSKILANFYLKEFDQDIVDNVKPLYYGRYVDDFIIAVEDTEDREINLTTILERLEKHDIVENTIIEKKDNNRKIALGEFNIDKEKIFLFNFEKDKTEIEHLKRAVNKNSSEWKLIPDTSEYDAIDSSDFFSDSNKECEEVDSLRKSTGITLKRNNFVKELIGFENNINLLTQEYWSNRLDKFLELIYEYVFDLKNFIDLCKFIPRLFGILIHSNNKKLHIKYFERLHEVTLFLSESVNNPLEIDLATKFIKDKIVEVIISSLSLIHSDNNFIVKMMSIYLDTFYLEDDLEYKVKQFFNCDLHRIPYKDCYFRYDEYVSYLSENIQQLTDELVVHNFFSYKSIEFVANNLHSTKCGCKYEKCDEECRIITKSSGFFFYTRRISLLELSIAFKNKIITESESFSDLAASYNYKISSIHADNSVPHQKDGCYFVDFDKKNQTINSLINPIIATTHFLTNYSSYDAVVRQILDTDLHRTDRIISLVNKIIHSKQKIDYLVFHELALPRNLYVLIATKLGLAGINLVAGLDYKINSPLREVDNQLIYVLKNLDGSINQSIALFQSKLIGAVHEIEDIREKANLRIEPLYKEKLIIRHNGFVFSGLICNDLLYIDNRSVLVGEVDNLFVIAWNQDTETYENLVKSSCLDIHSFVTLCNNRVYGDTRIRAPYKDSWKRDIMKIHGGINDSYIVGELDIKALRDFQTNVIPPKRPFKPFPIGFEISTKRRLL